MHIDFTVPVIDNFWDMGFALTLALSLLEKHSDTHISFYSENTLLFQKMLGADIQPEHIVYKELSVYETSEKNSFRINFFAYPIKESENPQTVINIDYLQFHRAKTSFEPGIEALHNTTYALGNSVVHHIVPSPLLEGGGVVFPWFFLPEKQTKKYDLSIFCYPESSPCIEEAMNHLNSDRAIRDFRNSSDFVSQREFLKILTESEKCIVRGENSLILAMCLGKPFLWDVYPEKNGAHHEKVRDLCNFLKDYLDPELIALIHIFATSEDMLERSNACHAFLQSSWKIQDCTKLSDYLQNHLLGDVIEKILYKNLQ